VPTTNSNAHDRRARTPDENAPGRAGNDLHPSGTRFQDQIERRGRRTPKAGKTPGHDHFTQPGFASLGAQGQPYFLTQGRRHAQHRRGGVVNPPDRIEVAFDGVVGIGFDDQLGAVGAERLAYVFGGAGRIAHVM
jgi:hypothetical protein